MVDTCRQGSFFSGVILATSESRNKTVTRENIGYIRGCEELPHAQIHIKCSFPILHIFSNQCVRLSLHVHVYNYSKDTYHF